MTHNHTRTPYRSDPYSRTYAISITATVTTITVLLYLYLLINGA